MHCLRVSGAGIVLVDEEERCRGRIAGERQQIEEKLQMKILILSRDLKQEIAAMPASRPDDSYRENVKGDSPIGLFYTRYPSLPQSAHANFIVSNPISSPAEQLAFPKPALSPLPASSPKPPFVAGP